MDTGNSVTVENMSENHREVEFDDYVENETEKNVQSAGKTGEVHEEVHVDMGARPKKPTDKYIEWQVSQSEHRFNIAVSAWRRRAMKTENILSSSRDLVSLQRESNALLKLMDDVADAFSRLSECHIDSSKQAKLFEKYDITERENHETIKRLSEYIRAIRGEVDENKSVKSVHSVRSRQSVGSYGSHISDRVGAAAEAAELKAKLNHIELESKKRAELEMVLTAKKLSMAEARIKAIDEVTQQEVTVDVLPIEQVTGNETVENYLQSHFPGNDTEQITYPPESVRDPATEQRGKITSNEYNVYAKEFQPRSMLHQLANHHGNNEERGDNPKVSRNQPNDSLLGIVEAFTEQVSIGRLPAPEPGIFSGDPLSYPLWKSAFDVLIGRKCIPPSEKIFYLKKYLSGSAKEAVEGYFLLSNEDAYEAAKKLLEERYGNDFVIGNAFRDKLESWPKISPRDGLGLRKFADFLQQCNTAVSTIKSLVFLNDDRENRKLLSKVPEWLVLRWARHVTDWKEKFSTFPPFSEFVKFVVKEANIACDPVTSQMKSNKFSEVDRKQERNSMKRTAGANSFSTVSKESKSLNEGNVLICHFCEGSHDIDDCKSFQKETMDNRKEFIMKKGLCFACLRRGHRSKECKYRKTCTICNQRHPTSIHETKNTPETAKTGICHLGNAKGCNKSSMILPVYVSHRDLPEIEVLVYALLDTQSDTAFILQETCNRLGVKGHNTQLNLSTMCSEGKLIECQKINGLLVRGHDSNMKISLPASYTREIMPANRSHIPTPDIASQWPHLTPIAGNLLPLSTAKVGLLIGYNCSRALAPREVIPPVENGPYGQKTDLGWGIVGIVDPDQVSDNDCIGFSHRVLTRELEPSLRCTTENRTVSEVSFSFRTKVKEVINPSQINQMMSLDFSENGSDCVSLSHNDRKFLSKVSSGIRLRQDNHYEMPLPFKDEEPCLPNNKALAIHRLMMLKRRFDKNRKYRDDYTQFMNDVINSGLAEKVPDSEICNENGWHWYVPHHGVYHPKKPSKIRVVFDCSAKFKGESLNDHLLQGPDLTNNMVGVLCRFRQDSVAFMCDVQQMFYQFRVAKEHKDFLRFLWWEDGDSSTSPTEYRMNVHLFGAVSSPGCANFGLRQLADDTEDEFGSNVANFIRRDFYVDDGLKSTATVQEAIELIKGSKEMCSRGGLKLHKFVSNSKEVLASIPLSDCASGVKTSNLLQDNLHLERALGVQWCIESDTFRFHIILQDQPLTRRGVLSTVSSVYDPLGFIAPVILIGKQILQSMCRERADWDDPVSDTIRTRWEHRRCNLHHLEKLEISRCFTPADFGKIKVTELHHFSDASTQGYGQCTYLRRVNDRNEVHCSLVMGKSRVTPLKQVTIPRLELTAALVSVKVSNFLQKELELENVTEIFWTDSKVVLGYITNDSRRFHVFVANRVQQIRDHTVPSQWRFVKTKENPADEASRGVNALEFVNESSWTTGPEFLWINDSSTATDDGSVYPVLCDDPEVKRSTALCTGTEVCKQNLGVDRFDYFSDWFRLKRAVANCLRYIRKLKKFVDSKHDPAKDLETIADEPCVDDYNKGEYVILRSVQALFFESEVKRFGAKEHTEKGIVTSSLAKLDPFLDEKGLLRVGGRIKKAALSPQHTHPVIIPKNSHVTRLIAKYCHERVEHQGRGLTMNEIRSNGYWIVGCCSLVSSLIHKCVMCQRMRGSTGQQKMADLPIDRLEPAPPFTYCAVDLFGPWLIKDGRKEVKRYGVLFTCMASRAIHLETSNSLTTDSFVNALRRFISVRGPIRQLRSDRGSNFVGAKRELAEAVGKMDTTAVHNFCLQNGCDFFEFKMNVPCSSHMGGVWERQIRTVRNVLFSLMAKNGNLLDDETLRTFMCEAAAIVNSRPLSVENMNDPTACDPLTPNHILTMKSNIILPPPGEFQDADKYCRKRWRRVQYLANEFWNHWRKEFLHQLQARTKWHKVRRNFAVGDVVIVKDECAVRNMWRLARVRYVFLDDDGCVRKVRLAMADSSLDSKGKRKCPLVQIERPIHKLVLLCSED